MGKHSAIVRKQNRKVFGIKLQTIRLDRVALQVNIRAGYAKNVRGITRLAIAGREC